MVRFSVCIVFALFLVLLSGAAAADSMLEISEVTVKVDGDKQSADEGGGTIDIKPESTLELKITIDNLFDSDVENAEIEDVEVEAILYEIDDDDDLEEQAEDFDLRPGRDKTVTIEFEIPLLLETDATYELILTAKGDDQNNTDHYDEVTFDVDVDKENHEIRFTKKELLPSTLTCGQSSTQLRFELLNTGQEDEDVELTVNAPNLGYSETESFEMVEDIDDDDNWYEFSDYIDVSDADAGTYSVTIRAEYNRGRDAVEETLSLVVEECATTPAPTPKPAPTPTTPPEPEPEPAPKPTTPSSSTSQQVDLVSPPSSSYVRPSQAAVATPKTSYSSSGGWWDDNKWIVLIVIADILLVAVGIAIVVALLRRRKG